MQANTHILVVDDDPDTLKLVSIVLHNEGYRISRAAAGDEALRIAQSSIPDLIVLDVMLPGMDGFAVARSLKANPETAQIPIIMFTAREQIDDKVEGYDAGVEDYVTKPTHPAELVTRVEAVLARHKPAAETQKSSAKPADRPQPQATVITILSATPGAGSTTVARHLVGSLTAGSSVLLEIAPNDASAVLDLTATALSDGFTTQDVQDAFQQIADEVRVLTAPTGGWEADQIPGLLNNLRQLCDLLVIDVGPNLDSDTYLAIQVAWHIVVVAEPTRQSLAACRELVNDLRQEAIIQHIHVLLVHKPHCADEVNYQAIQSGLNVESLDAIPIEAEQATAALDALARNLLG